MMILLRHVENLARRLNVSHSRLFPPVLKNFFCRWENQRLMEQINRAVDGLDDEEDIPDPAIIRRHMRRMQDSEW
jgi:hypothetical protein